MKTHKSSKKSGLIIVTVSTFVVVSLLILLVAGKTLYPDSESMNIIWKIIWLGGLPIMLLLSFRTIEKWRDKDREEERNKKRDKTDNI